MESSRSGPGYMPGVPNNQIGLGQQEARSQYVGRPPPNSTDNPTMNQLVCIIEDNKKLRDNLKQITELCKEKLTKSESSCRELMKEKKKLEEDIKDIKDKLFEASQNYENAKVVVLTYKTRNIHLESAAEELESKTAELEELKKKVADDENRRIIQLNERYAEDKATKSQQEVNRLQQILQARSLEVDRLNLVINNISKQNLLPADQLQWIMGETWKQQQHSQMILHQQVDELNAGLHDKHMLVLQLEHQLNELQSKKHEAETYRRIKGKNVSTEKIESLAVKLDNAQMYIDKLNQDIDEYKKEVQSKTEELKRKDASIKGLQDILKKQQSHQGDHSIRYQEKIEELNQQNEKLHKKIGELSMRCEHAETEYAVIKSVDLQSREELQKYKERIISLEHDIRKSRQVEKDLYKELDEAVKDFEDVSKRYRSLQNENTELKKNRPTIMYSGMDNAQLIQELGNKTNQVEILHGQIKAYADNLDRERRKVAMLTMENQNYQHQFQHLNSPPPPLPPRSSNFPSIKTQPVTNARQPWQPTIGVAVSRDMGSNQLMPERAIMVEPNYYHSESHIQGHDANTGRAAFLPRTYPTERLHTTPQFNSHSIPELSEPCPLCGKRFSTTDELTTHAATCN